MAVHPDLQAAADAGEHRAVETMIGWGFGRGMQIGGNRAPGSWAPGAGLRVLERGLAGPLGGDLRASNAYQGALAAAARGRCPALILAGDDDRMTPADRKSVVEGKRVSVRVDTGGPRSIKKKKKIKQKKK